MKNVCEQRTLGPSPGRFIDIDIDIDTPGLGCKVLPVLLGQAHPGQDLTPVEHSTCTVLFYSAMDGLYDDFAAEARGGGISSSPSSSPLGSTMGAHVASSMTVSDSG